jgi:hypothetical protein
MASVKNEIIIKKIVIKNEEPTKKYDYFHLLTYLFV